VTDLAGRSVSEARAHFREEYGIPDKATAKLNDTKVKGSAEFDTVLNDDDKLTFTVSRGRGAYLVGAALLALVLTSSTFAYTYTNTTAMSLNSTFAGSDWVTYEPSVVQPDWQQVMPGGTYDAAVNYDKQVTQSEVPLGNLFDITPHPDYTGDLHVEIYLTNTSELMKAYSYLNMELYVAKSVEAKNPPVYQVLSLENGVASFNIEGGSAKKYTVEVWGGAYRLVSSDPGEWGAGWNIVPELYCEVTQR